MSILYRFAESSFILCRVNATSNVENVIQSAKKIIRKLELRSVCRQQYCVFFEITGTVATGPCLLKVFGTKSEVKFCGGSEWTAR